MHEAGLAKNLLGLLVEICFASCNAQSASLGRCRRTEISRQWMCMTNALISLTLR